MAEVFDRENHVATIPYRSATNPSSDMIPEIGNWLVWYAKDKIQGPRKNTYRFSNLSTRRQNPRATCPWHAMFEELWTGARER